MSSCDKSQCSTCQSDCAERKSNFMETAHAESHIKKVIAIMSGKGGVGKSSMTSCIAEECLFFRWCKQI